MIQCIGTCISTGNCKRNYRSFIVICAEIGWISFLRGYLWYADRLDVGQSPKFLSVSHWDTFSESLSPPFAEVKLRLWPHLSKLTLRRRITYDGHKFPLNGPMTIVYGWKPSVPDPWRKKVSTLSPNPVNDYVSVSLLLALIQSLRRGVIMYLLDDFELTL